jgi:hypothetical protein
MTFFPILPHINLRKSAAQIDLLDLNRHVRFAAGECSHGTQIGERTVLGFGNSLAGTRSRRRKVFDAAVQIDLLDLNRRQANIRMAFTIRKLLHII